MFVKPYFRPKNTYDIELNKLKTTAKPDEPEATAKPDKLEAPLFTLKVPKELTKAIEPAIKRGRERLWKHPIFKNPVTENHLTFVGIPTSSTGISASFIGISANSIGISANSVGISIRQSLYMDISVLV